MNTEYNDMIYLVACAVNSQVPDKDRVSAMDLDSLYKACKWHTLRATVFTALKSAGTEHSDFFQAYNKAVRKNILFDSEREAITSEMEKQGIWYLPLKGAILKELYPQIGMREMSDNDIFYDSSRQNDLKNIMLSRGYTAESVGDSYTDVYKKPPVLNMEMHRALFLFGHDEKLFRYYEDMSRLMKRDDGKQYGYHFSDEDFYVYMTAHEYRHHIGGGTGIRSLVDCYVFMKAKEGTIDKSYIAEQFRQLGIEDYAQKRLSLAMKLFSSADTLSLTESEEKELEKYLLFGTYGTITNVGESSIKRYVEKSGSRSKAGFIMSRLFPSMEFMKHHYPFFYKTKVLLPVGYVWRWIKGLSVNRDKFRAEMKALKKIDKKK